MTEPAVLDRPAAGRSRVGRGRLPAVLVAVAAGLAWAAAHPSPGIWWLVFTVVPGWLTAVHLVRNDRAVVVAAVGASLGVAGFLPMLAWLGNVPGGSIAWPALALVLALYPAGASLVVRRWTGSRWVAIVGPVVWTGMEVARHRFPLGGFGWGDLASAHTADSWMLTVARVLGADGLTLITALLGGCAWATVVAGAAVRRQLAPVDDRTVSPGASRAVAVADSIRPLMLATVGVAMLGTLVTADVPPAVGEVDVLVVQGDDGDSTATGADLDREIAEGHADATVAAVAAGGVPDLTVWAESSLDRDPASADGADLAPAVRRAARAVAGNLVAGVTSNAPDGDTFRRQMVVYDAEGRPSGPVYDKQHPVPFGEYVPLRPLLGDLPPLRLVPRDMVAGSGPVTLRAGGIGLAPVICFETLFGGIVRDAVAADDAGLVVAGTNDTSYGVSDEAAQHLAQSRLRAVETGRVVVHASITGASAIVLPDGRITEATSLFEVATIRATVPVVSGTTPAMVVGSGVSSTLLLAAAGVSVHAFGRTVVRRRADTRQEQHA